MPVTSDSNSYVTHPQEKAKKQLNLSIANKVTERVERSFSKTGSSSFIDRSVRQSYEQQDRETLQRGHSIPAPDKIKVILSGVRVKSLAMRQEMPHTDQVIL